MSIRWTDTVFRSDLNEDEHDDDDDGYTKAPHRQSNKYERYYWTRVTAIAYLLYYVITVSLACA